MARAELTQTARGERERDQGRKSPESVQDVKARGSGTQV